MKQAAKKKGTNAHHVKEHLSSTAPTRARQGRAWQSCQNELERMSVFPSPSQSVRPSVTVVRWQAHGGRDPTTHPTWHCPFVPVPLAHITSRSV